MKCDKCKEKEASFFLRVSVDGETTETNLCEDCARAEGLTREETREPEGFFSGGILPLFAVGLPVAFMAMPFRDRRATAETETAPPSKLPQGIDPALNVRRELSALRYRLGEAVREERYEEAAALRDEILELEK